MIGRIRRLAASERAARHGGFWWGLAEGTFFFIVPDVYISLATLFSIRTGALAWAFSILGSLTAIALIFGITAGLGLDYLAFLENVPAISAAMIDEVRATFIAGRLPYTPLLVLGGVPLKVYGGVAFSLGGSLGAVLAWTTFARIVRILPIFALAAGVRLLLGRRIDTRPRPWLAAWVVAWVGFYIFYFSRMGGG